MSINKIAAPLAGRREWLALAALALPVLLVSMDATVTYLALPSLSAALKPTGTQLLWITDIFTFMEGGFLIAMGVLGDRIGQKRLLITGAIFFALASLMAAFANSTGILITARALLGITGATLLPCILALIRNMFQDERQRSLAFSVFTSCYSAGTMLGPLTGGILLDHFWWGSVFLIGVPLMILFLFVSGTLPEFRLAQRKPFDMAGGLLLLGSILSLIYGIKQFAEHGNPGWVSMLGIVAGIIMAIIFLRRQKTIEHPLINLHLFKIPAFTVTLTALFFALFCWSGIYLFIAQYLQSVVGLNPLHAGLFTIPPAAVCMFGCMLAPQALRWLSQKSVILTGMIMFTIGMLMLTQLNANTGLFFVLAAGTFISLGSGLVVTIGINLVVSTAPPDQAGAVSGISETSTTFGTAFGVALLGSIGASIYKTRMPETLLSNLPASAKGIRNTLGEALEVSKQLPRQISVGLIAHAKEAFVQSFKFTALVASVLMVMVLLVFLLAMRGKVIVKE